MTVVYKQPELSPLELPPTITYGEFSVPTDLIGNLRYRANLMEQAERNANLQQELWEKCSQSWKFFFDVFLYTEKVRLNNPDGSESVEPVRHYPFVLYPYQRKGGDRMVAAVDNSRDIGCEKSRQMGVSWMMVGLVLWFWLFRPGFKGLLMSRVEGLVDDSGNPLALFYKLDYMLDKLPGWMQPPKCKRGQQNRTHMRLTNPFNGAVVNGSATHSHSSRGDTRDLLVLDEFGAVERGAQIRAASTDAALCRWVNGTSYDGSEFNRWMDDGTLEIITFPWWDHPEKGRGRYVVRSGNQWDIRSPYYDREVQERSKKDVLENLDMCRVTSAQAVVEPAICDKLIVAAKETPRRFSIHANEVYTEKQLRTGIRTRDKNMVALTPSTNGELYWWGSLQQERPEQNDAYIIGCDISMGRGESNSVASIRSLSTGHKLGELVSAQLSPTQFAKAVMALAVWVGGSRSQGLPYLIWELNNPGIEFGRAVVEDYAYPFIYSEVRPTSRHSKTESMPGWYSNRDKKRKLLARYIKELEDETFFNPSAIALTELRSIVEYDDGAIGPQHLARETSSARRTHADRVIADMLTCAAPELYSPRQKQNVMMRRIRQNQLRNKGDRFNFG